MTKCVQCRGEFDGDELQPRWPDACSNPAEPQLCDVSRRHVEAGVSEPNLLRHRVAQTPGGMTYVRDESGGTKHDREKPRMALLPPRPIAEIVDVLTFGAQKYEAYNWTKGISFERLHSALQRHLWQWWAGEDHDGESGRHHLAHAGCCLLFLMELRHSRPEYDDRPEQMTLPFVYDLDEGGHTS